MQTRVTLVVPACQPGWEEMENLTGNLRKFEKIWENLRKFEKRFGRKFERK